MTLIGPTLVAVLCALGVTLAVNAVLPYGTANTLSIALASGLVVAVSQCLILAARPSLLEPLFGGLDRMYRVHKWLGISAMALMIGHQLVEPHFVPHFVWAKDGEVIFQTTAMGPSGTTMIAQK